MLSGPTSIAVIVKSRRRMCGRPRVEDLVQSPLFRGRYIKGSHDANVSTLFESLESGLMKNVVTCEFTSSIAYESSLRVNRVNT